MWVNKGLYQIVLDDNKTLTTAVDFERTGSARMSGALNKLVEQKAKDDLTIDWMRHRINALERANSILMNKVSGVSMPVPEIVASRPGTMSNLPESMTHMPSFEDVGDGEAGRLGIEHDAEGTLVFRK